MTPTPQPTRYEDICRQECEWCRLGMPFVTAIRKIDSAPIHEVSSPGSNSDDYERCAAPTKDAVIEALFRYYEETHNATGMGYPSHRLKNVGPNQAAVIEVIERQAKQIEELRKALALAHAAVKGTRSV